MSIAESHQAIVLLLGAISLQQIGLSISLVLCFSVGLAIVLSGLGILLVSAKKWFQKFPISPKDQLALPIVSASVIPSLISPLSHLWARLP